MYVLTKENYIKRKKKKKEDLLIGFKGIQKKFTLYYFEKDFLYFFFFVLQDIAYCYTYTNISKSKN